MFSSLYHSPSLLHLLLPHTIDTILICYTILMYTYYLRYSIVPSCLPCSNTNIYLQFYLFYVYHGTCCHSWHIDSPLRLCSENIIKLQDFITNVIQYNSDIWLYSKLSVQLELSREYIPYRKKSTSPYLSCLRRHQFSTYPQLSVLCSVCRTSIGHKNHEIKIGMKSRDTHFYYPYCSGESENHCSNFVIFRFLYQDLATRQFNKWIVFR